MVAPSYSICQALRGLRVNWTKIDIRVDDFDIQICTSPQAMSSAVPPSLSTSNASWFLKVLSESGPLIIHIHDRRYPQQRQRIHCPCPQCSPLEENETAEFVHHRSIFSIEYFICFQCVTADHRPCFTIEIPRSSFSMSSEYPSTTIASIASKYSHDFLQRSRSSAWNSDGHRGDTMCFRFNVDCQCSSLVALSANVDQ